MRRTRTCPQAMRDQHPVVPLLLEHRRLTKLRSTYVAGALGTLCEQCPGAARAIAALQARPAGAAGAAGGVVVRVRAHVEQAATATGRLSVSKPSLQVRACIVVAVNSCDGGVRCGWPLPRRPDQMPREARWGNCCTSLWLLPLPSPVRPRRPSQQRQKCTKRGPGLRTRPRSTAAPRSSPRPAACCCRWTCARRVLRAAWRVLRARRQCIICASGVPACPPARLSACTALHCPGTHDHHEACAPALEPWNARLHVMVMLATHADRAAADGPLLPGPLAVPAAGQRARPVPGPCRHVPAHERRPGGAGGGAEVRCS